MSFATSHGTASSPHSCPRKSRIPAPWERTLTGRSWSMHGGYRGGGAIAKHEWKGLGKGGLRRLEDHVEQERENAVEGGMYA